MDRIFEHFERMVDDMVFSGFFDARKRGKPATPRDEMLREREDDGNDLEHDLPDPEPWIPFPFFGDLVKPDVMDRDFFRKSQWLRKNEDSARKDIILDDDVPVDNIFESNSSGIQKWSRSLSRRAFFGPDGERIETEIRVNDEPDGTQTRTTIERSPRGERRVIVRRYTDGREEVEECDTTFSAVENASKTLGIRSSQPKEDMHFPNEEKHKPGGIFDFVRRWFRSES